MFASLVWLNPCAGYSTNNGVVDVFEGLSTKERKICVQEKQGHTPNKIVHTDMFSTSGKTQGTEMDGILLKQYINLQASYYHILPSFLSLHEKRKHRLWKLTRTIWRPLSSKAEGKKEHFGLFTLITFMLHIQERVHSTTSASVLVEK